jgi:hypothetical protein
MEAQLLKTKCVLLLWHRIAFCFSFSAMANSRRHNILEHQLDSAAEIVLHAEKKILSFESMPFTGF